MALSAADAFGSFPEEALGVKLLYAVKNLSSAGAGTRVAAFNEIVLPRFFESFVPGELSFPSVSREIVTAPHRTTRFRWMAVRRRLSHPIPSIPR